MFEVKVEESLVYPGYYHVPICDWVVISIEGKVIDTLSGKNLSVIKNGHWPYPTVQIPSFRTVSVHRLMAITFLKCPGDPDLYQVNHINGDKDDHSLENLEWTTASENAIHAYESGLRTDNKPVKIRDLKTNEEKEFYSLQEAARFFKVNGGTLHGYLNNRDDLYPFKLKWDVIYKGEEWRPLTKSHIGQIRKGLPKPVVIVHDDGRIVVYESGTHAGLELGVSNALVRCWISGKNNSAPHKLKCYYLHEYKNSLDDAEFVEQDKSHYKTIPIPKRKPVKIKVTNVLTNEIEFWDSTEVFANSLGVLKNTMQKRMLLNNGMFHQYLIEYLKD